MDTTAKRPQFTGGNVTVAEPLGQSQRIARQVFRVLTMTFVAGIAAQLLIVGMALFVDGARWNLHTVLGHMMVLVPPAMLIAALVGQMSSGVKLMSGLLILLIIFQFASAIIGNWTGAFHPLNALVMFGIGTIVYRRTLAENVDAPGFQGDTVQEQS
jgi:hypothetical protein